MIDVDKILIEIENAREELLKSKRYNNNHDNTHEDRVHFLIIDKILINLREKIKTIEK